MYRRSVFTALAVVVLGTGMFPSVAAAQEEPEALLSGRFQNVVHAGTGVATVYQLPDGSRTLRLTEFRTDAGPDLRVYLVAAADTPDSDSVADADIVDLGELQGNTGNQSYDVPADLDLGKYRSVSIWCKRFSVNFTSAPLRAGPDH